MLLSSLQSKNHFHCLSTEVACDQFLNPKSEAPNKSQILIPNVQNVSYSFQEELSVVLLIWIWEI
jgi:hypothetical protein